LRTTDPLIDWKLRGSHYGLFLGLTVFFFIPLDDIRWWDEDFVAASTKLLMAA
jgi:hypothetical protein